MRYFRAVISGMALILLCGCPTGAQRQFQAMRMGNQQAAANLKSCATAAYNLPDIAAIRGHLPFNVNDATLQQLSDTSFATTEEVQAIFAHHPRLKECRKAFLASLAQSEPALVPILIASFNKGDDDLLGLVQRKITWGQYLHQVRDRVAEGQAAIQSEDRRVVSGLKEDHEIEIARRQRAAEALAAWAQTQQVINAMNRPVITNCSRFGSIMNCVSE